MSIILRLQVGPTPCTCLCIQTVFRHISVSATTIFREDYTTDQTLNIAMCVWRDKHLLIAVFLACGVVCPGDDGGGGRQ